MRDVLGEAKRRLAHKIDSNSTLLTEPMAADPWIVSSLLQKSVRRGETDIAQRAALTLLKWRGSAIWRRLMIIAFEDVGAGNSDAVIMTVAAGCDAAWRRARGEDARVVAALTTLLAEAPKDRSADHLVGAKDHPALADFAEGMASAPVEARLSSARDRELSLQHRAIATYFTCSAGHDVVSKPGLEALLALFRELGVPEDLCTATGIAAVRTREPITVMVPLIWSAVSMSKDMAVCDCPVPPLVTAADLPLYALDEHTRLGREAIRRFARENEDVRNCLDQYVPTAQRRRTANVGAFYVDAAPLAKRLVWDQSAALETFGTERDLLHAGVHPEGIEPLLRAMRANLGHLNKLRAEVLARTRTEALPNRVAAP